MGKKHQIKFSTTFSTFVSTRIVGEGGSGIVYECKDEKGQKFAIKLLKKQGLNTDKRKRFENEITFCQRSSHPRIISVVGHGLLIENDVEIPFYVMPFYDSSLRTLIEKGIKPGKVVYLFSQILDAVEAAHLQKIYHRDIKPENLLCNVSDESLVLADFGIARFLEDELYTAVETKAYDRLANFQYAAPEQRIRNGCVNQCADIYAIGLILNEMFTNEVPQGTGYKTISSIAPEYSYLDAIVEKMIRQNPEERFSSIKEIKVLLKIHGEEYISEQKLSKLRSTVIPLQEIDDPLVVNPLVIEEFDWEKGLLVLTLSQAVNNKWIQALHNIGGFTSLTGKGPKEFIFDGNLAKISAQESQVQSIINYFKSWIPIVTNEYKRHLDDERKLREENERKLIDEYIKAEEAKARLRKTIKL